MDKELDGLKPVGLPADMQRWNIEDLDSYIKAMRVEIGRVEKIISEKTEAQSAADALFGGSAN